MFSHVFRPFLLNFSRYLSSKGHALSQFKRSSVGDDLQEMRGPRLASDRVLTSTSHRNLLGFSGSALQMAPF